MPQKQQNIPFTLFTVSVQLTSVRMQLNKDKTCKRMGFDILVSQALRPRT